MLCHTVPYLAARNNEDDENKEEESKKVVKLILVDSWENEKQLYEAGAKW